MAFACRSMISTITLKAMVMGIAANCAREDKKPETAVGSSEIKVLPSTFCTITVRYRNPRTSGNACITALSKKIPSCHSLYRLGEYSGVRLFPSSRRP
jgi:hypothetical protein